MARPSMIAQIHKRVMRNQKKAVIYLIIGIFEDRGLRAHKFALQI